ncbi:AbrB/MazE/SpoVT family DNA-binding domain-containing protein [Phreatobacter sp.]|uniref:AbrB/MazE/SpoVT family DNA-binding domain-containing protein n=1 Tax=Phreatobacter sp. TaxID=1966341 RepID=UPI003F70DCD6
MEAAVNDQPRRGDTEGFVLQVRKIGNSVGLILPKELVARANLREGDRLHVAELADGSLQLSARDPHFAKGMESAGKAIRRYRNALAELAK